MNIMNRTVTMLVAVTLVSTMFTAAPAAAHTGHDDNFQHFIKLDAAVESLYVDTNGTIGITLDDYNKRDQLIADQEALLNVYRCKFDVDTQIVPGGCRDQRPVRPPATPVPVMSVPKVEFVAFEYTLPFYQSPRTRTSKYWVNRDIELRDHLIIDQENLLNVYRCKFDVDTQIVPGGGCSNGKPPDPAFFTAQIPLQPFIPSFPDGYPLTAEELGCTDFASAACRIGDDGFPVATRLLTRDEIDQNVSDFNDPDTYHTKHFLLAPEANSDYWDKIWGFYPKWTKDAWGLIYSEDGKVTQPEWVDIVPDNVALSYISKCLKAWPAYTGSVLAKFNYDGDPENPEDDSSPVVACNAVWTMMRLPINFAGITDYDCLWNEFEAFYFRQRPTIADRYGITLPEQYFYPVYLDKKMADGGVMGPSGHFPASDYPGVIIYPAYIGWGEVCDSWVDPDFGPQETNQFRCMYQMLTRTIELGNYYPNRCSTKAMMFHGVWRGYLSAAEKMQLRGRHMVLTANVLTKLGSVDEKSRFPAPLAELSRYPEIEFHFPY